MKPDIPDDEKCLPWNLSAVPATTLNVARLKVPSRARDEYRKACDSAHKNKLEESEGHLRRAIEKFKDYSAAWVLLGVILDEQHKEQEARDACAQAAAIERKYLPAHLCMAEFSARNREWARLLEIADIALGIDAEYDGYAYYYRAMANFSLNNLADAQKSASRAAEIDANHSYLPLYVLIAQIYKAQGDKVTAAAQLREALKRHGDPAQEDVARQYLAKLEAEETATPAKKSETTDKSEDPEPLTELPSGWTIASLGELRNAKDTWIPEDIDYAVPAVDSGAACALPAVLDGAGQRIMELVHNVDRFTATENLLHQAVDHAGHMGPAITAKFNYLVSYKENTGGYQHVDEFRNGSLSIEAFPDHIATLGTPSLILIFHPRYVGNFKVECEGLGQWNGEPAWQVRFEQRADRPNLTYSITVNRETRNVNLRGRAWILAGSYQVARLETDLEEAIPEIRLRLDHQSVEYRPVEMPTSHMQLWLPSSTELYMDFQGRRFYRKHSFTDFKLFSVGTDYKTANPKGAAAEQ